MQRNEIQDPLLQPTTPTVSDIKRKEMRQGSQKHFGMLKILAMNLQSNGLLLIERASADQPGSRSCNLCLTEKLAILLADKRAALNRRSELTGKCRHKNKFKLKNVRA